MAPSVSFPELIRHPRFRSIACYALPSFFSKGVGLILVPLYLTQLSVSQFGQFDLLTLTGTFLQLGFHFGLSGAHIRFFKEDDVSTADLNRTLLILRVLVLTLVLAFLIILDPALLAFWITDDPQLEFSLILVVALYALREYALFVETRYRALEMASRYAGLNMGIGAMNLVAIYYFLIIQELGISGIFLGQVVSYTIAFLLLTLLDGKWLLKGKFDPKLMRRCLKFSLPLVPHELSIFFITASDRFMLKELFSPQESALVEVGIYSLAVKFVALMTLITRGFQLFWSPFVYANYKQGDIGLKFAFFFRVYSGALFAFSLLITLALPLVFHFFPAYEKGGGLVPVMLASFIIFNIGAYFCIGIEIREQPSIRARAGVIAAVANLLLNWILIPRLGALGAALATFMVYILYAGIAMPASQRLFPVDYPLMTWMFPVIWLALGYPVVPLGGGGLIVYAILGGLIFLGLFRKAGGLRMEWRGREHGG